MSPKIIGEIPFDVIDVAWWDRVVKDAAVATIVTVRGRTMAWTYAQVGEVFAEKLQEQLGPMETVLRKRRRGEL